MKYLIMVLCIVSTPCLSMEIDPDCDGIDVRDLRISCAAAVFHDKSLCSHISNEYDRSYCNKVVDGDKK